MRDKGEDLAANIVLSDYSEGETGEMIPIISPEEAEKVGKENFPEQLPILPLRNTVLYPGVVLPITVGRQKSIRLVKKAYKSDRIIGVVAQKNSNNDDPNVDDVYKTGTVARIIRMFVLPDGNTTIIIQGRRRFEIEKFVETDPYFIASIKLLEESFPKKSNKEMKAVTQTLKETAEKILQLNPDIPREAQIALDNIESPGFMVHFLSSNLNVDVKDKQRILETENGMQRATILLEHMLKEVQMLELKQEIQSKVHSDLDQQQRDFFLRQQMKVLQDELGYDSADKEVDELRTRAEQKKWPEDVAKHFRKELDKVARMNPAMAEYPIALNYAEFLVDLPWEEYTLDNFDLIHAKKVLDKDHFGLEKVKKRIIEYLAVLKLKDNMKAPILCLYGPPGVGKTSLGKSIAKALDRKYVRMALGGVRDEAEIRGHRKTYVGAMPGKIIQNLKKSGSSNPVFVLDEIDKVGADFRGDPSSALLEVLDPEQNNAFSDNYLEVEYDLSKVLFVATANSLDTIHPALRDRMEIIEISGYTVNEKVEIAKRHLIPKQRQEHGLKAKDISFSKAALVKIIEGYTRESGVRELDRRIASVSRNIARKLATEEKYDHSIKPESLREILGMEIYDNEQYESNELAGIVPGLAWTRVGGEILLIESSLSKGKGKLTLSGQLGDVMKESAMAALSYLRANAEGLGINHKVFDQYDLHVHVPSGAVPKDGPSAGITMFTSLASIYTQRKVKAKLAMTGEITLRGKVLPVGGIKEKLLAAKRAGIKEVILCSKNRKDIEEIEKGYLDNLKIHYVDHVEQVLDIALLKQKVKKPMDLTVTTSNKS